MNRDRVVRAVRETSIKAAELEDDLRDVRSLLGTKNRSRDILESQHSPTRIRGMSICKVQKFSCHTGLCAEYVTRISPVFRGLGLASPTNND
jgi:hypothetical protein